MNRQLLNPFRSNFPQSIEFSLEDANNNILSAKFHPLGHSLASGCSNGDVLVWDIVTKSIIRRFKYHMQSIKSVQWFKKSASLLSCSQEGSVAEWNVFSGEKVFDHSFSIMKLESAQYHPSDKNVLLIIPFQELPFMFNISTKQSTSILCLSNSVTCAGFHYSGETIAFGDSKGSVFLVDYPKLEVSRPPAKRNDQVVHSTQISTTSTKSILFSENGELILANSNDRTVRLFSFNSNLIELKFKFQDLVNKYQWSEVGFSGDQECIIAGTLSKAVHNVYIWDKLSGNLIKILEGPKEGLLSISWHPFHPIACSISSYGILYIWSCAVEENWSAFAPDFIELEENTEYEEREDEFDIPKVDDFNSPLVVKQLDEEIDLDIGKISNIVNFEDLLYIPLLDL